MTSATRQTQCTASDGVLVMAVELGKRRWQLTWTAGVGQRVRRRTIPVPTAATLAAELGAAKRRLGLPAAAPVESCYEAGPEGFWVHRLLTALGVRNRVVDSSSIEVNRRARQAKTDRLDGERLLALLLRVLGGERAAWREVRVPPAAAEDARQVTRELRTLKADRTRLTNRLGGLLATVGCRGRVRARGTTSLAGLTQWDGTPLPPQLAARLTRLSAQVSLLCAHIRTLEQAVAAAGRGPATDRAAAQIRALRQLRGVGPTGAAVLVRELFGWRQFRTRREVGALTGLTPTPACSGQRVRDRGLSRAGNAALRGLAVELAWAWVRFQPQSALAQWFATRFAAGGRRLRKIGIVAVARRLVIALWRYLDAGVVPAGAVFKTRPA